MSMDTCDKGHDHIVYVEFDRRGQRHNCPVCDALDRVKELEGELEDMTNEKTEFSLRVKELEAEKETE